MIWIGMTMWCGCLCIMTTMAGPAVAGVMVAAVVGAMAPVRAAAGAAVGREDRGAAAMGVAPVVVAAAQAPVPAAGVVELAVAAGPVAVAVAVPGRVAAGADQRQ